MFLCKNVLFDMLSGLNYAMGAPDKTVLIKRKKQQRSAVETDQDSMKGGMKE